MLALIKTIEISIALIALINGLVCSLSPWRMIKFQQYFYARINWRIEPIDMKKEIRNTRAMGIMSFVLSVLLFLQAIK